MTSVCIFGKGYFRRHLWPGWMEGKWSRWISSPSKHISYFTSFLCKRNVIQGAKIGQQFTITNIKKKWYFRSSVIKETISVPLNTFEIAESFHPTITFTIERWITVFSCHFVHTLFNSLQSLKELHQVVKRLSPHYYFH